MNRRTSNPKPGSRDPRTLQLTPDQCRAARGLLDMTRNRLAAEAQVSLATLLQFENGDRPIKTRTQALIRMALEANGVQFIPEGDGGVGVRFRDSGTHVVLPQQPPEEPAAAAPGAKQAGSGLAAGAAIAR